jgi:DNA-binding SARP family transcriptional activator
MTEVQTGAAVSLHVFNGPFVTVDGHRHAIPDCGVRLLVWLALRRSRVDRTVAAGTLWPVVDDRRAVGNLRSALWRLRGAGLELVESTNTTLCLRSDVVVDVHVAADWAQRVIAAEAGDDDIRIVPWFADAVGLLAGWDDDWAMFERERLRHRTLHAFEQLSRLLCTAGRCAEGVRAARIVVDADPLRESAQCALIEAHLAAGEIGKSRRVLQTYTDLHRRVFGVEPSSRLGSSLPARLGAQADDSSSTRLLSAHD